MPSLALDDNGFSFHLTTRVYYNCGKNTLQASESDNDGRSKTELQLSRSSLGLAALTVTPLHLTVEAVSHVAS